MTDGIYYIQESSEGFLVGSTCKGDAFTCDPVKAIRRKHPWGEGRFGTMYTCRKICISTLDFSGHLDPQLRTFVSKSRHNFGKLRYFYECPRCKKRTKDYATEETAREMWHTLTADCTKQVAQFV